MIRRTKFNGAWWTPSDRAVVAPAGEGSTALASRDMSSSVTDMPSGTVVPGDSV